MEINMKQKLAAISLCTIISTLINPVVNAKGDFHKGKSIAATCAGCHGSNGFGVSEEFPNLAGQKQLYLIKQLKDYKSGKRKDPTMKSMAVTLSNIDIENVTAYYSNLKQITAIQSVPEQVKTEKPTNREFPTTVFISMKKSKTVETFPAEDIWNGGPNMLYTAVTPDGNRVLSTSPSENTVYIFNAKNGKRLAIIPVGKAPKGVKVTPDGKHAYISNQGSSNISVISLNKLSVVDTIKVESGPHNVRFTRNGKIAYVTLQGGAGIGVIDTSKREMIRVIPVPGITGPHNMDLSHDEKTAYVRDFVHHVAVLDLKSGKVKKVIKVGNGHGGIDTSPDGRFVATAAIGDDFISVINTVNLSIKNIKVGNGPHGIRASENGQWLYVTVTKDNQVVVINTKTMKVEKRIAVGKFPFWIAVVNNP